MKSILQRYWDRLAPFCIILGIVAVAFANDKQLAGQTKHYPQQPVTVEQSQSFAVDEAKMVALRHLFAAQVAQGQRENTVVQPREQLKGGLANLFERVEKLEKSLESDYDRYTPLSPQLFTKLQTRNEENKDELRRKRLLFNINGALFYSYKDGISTVYESVLKPIDDPITQQVLEEYRKLGWKVTYLPNPAKPDSGLGYVQFELPQVKTQDDKQSGVYGNQHQMVRYVQNQHVSRKSYAVREYRGEKLYFWPQGSDIMPGESDWAVLPGETVDDAFERAKQERDRQHAATVK